MKKRASAKKPAAKKLMTARAGVKPGAAVRVSRDSSASAQRAPAEVDKAKYTPAPLKTDGWPAFRYPLS